MRNRVAVAVLSAAFALALAGLATAGPSEVVNGGVPYVANGTVVAKTADSVVIRTDDHGHKVTFAIERTTVLPGDITVGRHVRVVYHPMGATGQTADTMAIAPPQTASR
jgi:hypothetical protein